MVSLDASDLFTKIISIQARARRDTYLVICRGDEHSTLRFIRVFILAVTLTCE